MAIPVVIDKRAACAPSRFRPVKATLLGLIAEGTVAQVVQEDVMSPLGEEEIDVTVVIRVAGADSLPLFQSRRGGTFGDGARYSPAKRAIAPAPK
jgi:hypothetical protein